jgi:Fe-S-cluster-containing hydrogenase component 2
MKRIRKIIEINEDLCDGCGNCVPACAEGALEIVDGKARVIADIYCDGLGACLGECPNNALRVVERATDEFDEDAVEKHLAGKQPAAAQAIPVPTGGCPSTRLQVFSDQRSGSAPVERASSDGAESSLSHWPVQIMLIPPTAPFLKGADLLVLADCVPVAFPTLHRDFLKGKAVMMGCPKLDDAQQYIDKFAQIFRQAGIRRVTAVVMEVPCCSGLPAIVKKAMQQSGVSIPVEEVIISTRGKILQHRRTVAA